MKKKGNNRGPDPKIPTLLQLCAEAGGRCQFDGCNKYLFQDEITLAKFNSSNVAHIVASSPNGPRGDSERSYLLSDKLDNLILMCPEHHKEIDAFPEQYTEEILLEMKKRHIDAIYEQCEMIYKETSNILIFLSPIKGNIPVSIDFDQVATAVMPEKKINRLDRQRIEVNGTAPYCSSEFWCEVSRGLQMKYSSRIESVLESQNNIHFSVFPLAPMPLIMKLGYLMGDKVRADIYQYQRDKDSWIWFETEQTNTFFIEINKIREGERIGLVFCLTADIDMSRITAAFDADTIFFVKARYNGVDCIKSVKDLTVFWHTYQKVCDMIKNQYPSVAEISVFPAMPASAAFEVGRRYMYGIYPKFKIYDDDNGFFETITIGGDN